jgi:hypothetical protein
MAVQPRLACGGVPGGAAGKQVGFAQQATRSRREARVEKALAQAGAGAVPDGGGQAVAALDIVFGAEVFQVHPLGRNGPLHAGDKGIGQVATKGFDDDIAGCQRVRVRQGFGVSPVADGDARLAAPRLQAQVGVCAPAHLWGHPLQNSGVVHPQAHLMAALAQV